MNFEKLKKDWHDLSLRIVTILVRTEFVQFRNT